MKKFLSILTIIVSACWFFVFMMLIEPAIVGYDDGIGFFIEYVSVVLLVVTIVSWLVFGIVRAIKKK